jgi:hypothetical protein
MPYKLKNVGKNKYYVVSARHPNERLSNHPLSLQRAKKQIKAVSISENKRIDKMIDEIIDEELNIMSGGDANQTVADIGTTASQFLKENVLYNLPTVGKILKPIGEFLDANVEKLGTLFQKPKTLESAKAKEQGIDLFDDQSYIINYNYPQGDPRRYEGEYNGIKYNKADQDLYKEYQFLTQGNTMKYLKQHELMYPEFAKRLNKALPTSIYALTRLHGH